MNRLWAYSISMLFIILNDQFSKGYIQSNFDLGDRVSLWGDFLHFTYVRNYGMAFGIWASLHETLKLFVFQLVPCLACLWLVRLMWKERNNSLMDGISYTLILAGAIGNLMDRFTLGHVVDFIDIQYMGMHFPTFNVADLSITIGLITFIISYFRDYFASRKKVPITKRTQRILKN